MVAYVINIKIDIPNENFFLVLKNVKHVDSYVLLRKNALKTMETDGNCFNIFKENVFVWEISDWTNMKEW
jgi:hypothetical protein